MKKYIPVLFLLLSQTVFGQLQNRQEEFYLINRDLHKDAPKRHYVNLSLNTAQNAVGIPNGLINTMVQTGVIDENTKANTYPQLRSVNRFGFDIDYSLNYKYRSDKLTYTFGVRMRDFFAASFTDNFFKLYVDGNAEMAGRQVDLAPTYFRRMSYQDVQLGLEKFLEKPAILVGGSISLIKGSVLQEVNITKGDFYTDPDGRYITLDVAMDAINTDKEGKAFYEQFNGLGTAVNLYGYKEFGKHSLSLSMKDLGWIRYKNLPQFEVDSNIRFEGIVIDDLFNMNGDSSLNSLTGDKTTEELLGATREYKNFTRFLPASFQLHYSYLLKQNIRLSAGARYLVDPTYRPMLYLQSEFSLPARITVAPLLSFGGWGNTDVGLKLGKGIADQFFLSADIFYIEGLLFPDQSSGQSIYLSLTGMF